MLRLVQVLAVAGVLGGLGLGLIWVLGTAPVPAGQHVTPPPALDSPSGSLRPPAQVAAAARRAGRELPLPLAGQNPALPATAGRPPVIKAMPSLASPAAAPAGDLGFGLVAPEVKTAAPAAHVSSSLRSGRAQRFSVAGTSQVTLKATVAVGQLPTGVAVGATRAYVANANANTVSVIDTTANPMTVIATVPVGAFPVGVAVSGDGSQAYVANFTAGTLSVISAATNTVARTIPVGSRPDGVVASGSFVYVANLLSGTISVVDPAAGTVTATIVLGGNAAPSGLAVGGGRLYADDARNGRTYVVDLGTASVLGSVASGSHPAYLAVAGPLAYVASPGTNSVTVLDTTATPPTAPASIPVGTAPYGVAAVPTSALVLTTNSGSGNLSVINSLNRTVIGTVTLGNTPDAIAVSPDNQTAFVTNEHDNTVSVLHVNQPPVAGSVSFGGAVGNTVFGVGISPTAPSTSAAGSVLSNSTDPEGNPLTAGPAMIATAHGGSVALNANGTFTYTPAPGFVGADSFTFTVSDGGPVTSSATATVTVANRVWYVKNNDPGANDGRSTSPFHTLAQAQAASSAGDFIYVFKGDGTNAGLSTGIALKANQHLIGEAQSLVVGSVTLFSVTPTVSCSSAPAGCPQLAASSGAVVTMADGTTVAGLAINPSGTAHGISGDGSVTSGATVDNVNVNDTGSGEGVILTGSTGTVAVTNSSITGGSDDGMVVSGSAGTLNLTLTGDTFSEPNTGGNDALNITTTGSAAINPTIATTAFTSARGDLFQLNIGDTSSSTLSFMNNTLSNNNGNIVSGGGGVTITAGGGAAPAATLKFDIQHNTFRDALGNAVIFGNASGNNTMTGTFSNNTVGVQGVVNSGSAQGSDLSVAGVQGGSIGITVEHNTLYQYNNFGATFQTTATFALNAKVDNNTIGSPGNNTPGFFGTGLQLNAGTTTGDTNAVCFDAFANNVAGSGFGGGFDIKLRQRQTTTVRLPGYPGPGTETAAAYTIAQNSPPTPTAATTGSFGGGGPCSGL